MAREGDAIQDATRLWVGKDGAIPRPAEAPLAKIALEPVELTGARRMGPAPLEVMRLVITAGPPDIWVGLEPETGEEAMALGVRRPGTYGRADAERTRSQRSAP
jgi:hypothetical protein